MKPVFTHYALHVHDLDACIDFYERYCGLKVVRAHGTRERTIWMAAEGRERDFVLVLVSGGAQHRQAKGDMTHYGFAVEARAEIDRIADLARAEGCLHWEPMELPEPVGYLCGVTDPAGYVVEFSYGQPLGPGATPLNESGG